ncbi:MAG TPA: BolA/IbaG family iron-sulfur metabolism protein [Bdellovibrionota bacterium]|nr:BolA/IbaG family iron-sulfur metabolism protein [Bdellovibrionota bacterium]
MTPAALKARLEQLAPGTEARVTDLTGTEDHYEAVVISSAFAGKGRMECHRMVYTLVKEEMASGEVHALTFKTFTPEQFGG